MEGKEEEGEKTGNSPRQSHPPRASQSAEPETTQVHFPTTSKATRVRNFFLDLNPVELSQTMLYMDNQPSYVKYVILPEFDTFQGVFSRSNLKLRCRSAVGNSLRNRQHISIT